MLAPADGHCWLSLVRVTGRKPCDFIVVALAFQEDSRRTKCEDPLFTSPINNITVTVNK